MKESALNGPPLDFRICGDKLEQDRIELEHNLLHTDLSLHLSSDTDNPDGSSIEYPRHNSAPCAFASFASFEHHTEDDFEGDNYPYGYRNEEGINPYGETISTAAHHASALTLSAGLAGRGTRNISLSGAEYDPDRPLHDMIGGMKDLPSLLGSDPKYLGTTNQPPDVGTIELERVLQSGYTVPPGSQHHPPPSSPPSDSDTSHSSSRPKLSEALRRVSFSPQRPRNAQSHRSHVHPHPRRHAQHGNMNSRDTIHRVPTSLNINDPTSPKPCSKKRVVLPHASSHSAPHSQPPTQSSSSKLFKAQSTEVEAATSTDKSSKGQARNPFNDVLNKPSLFDGGHQTATLPRSSIKTSRKKPFVQLPDVTGLTSAVESPAKPSQMHYTYAANARLRETETQLLSTLSAIQSKLSHLESENSISRRRVRELELELEACKTEVVHERTRVMDRGNVVQQHPDVDLVNPDATKGGKVRSVEAENARGERYNEVVEEKTALESLIATLRAHLTRLTAELSSQQQLLIELRSLRESDRKELKKKSREVEKLREEVERLAEEVEVLRAVVEEGLKERRVVKGHPSAAHVGPDFTLGNSRNENEELVEVIEEKDEDAAEAIKSGSEDLEYTSRNLDYTGPLDAALLPSSTPPLTPRHMVNIDRPTGKQKPERSTLALPQSRSHSPCTPPPRSPSPTRHQRRDDPNDRPAGVELASNLAAQSQDETSPSHSTSHPQLSSFQPTTPIRAREPRKKPSSTQKISEVNEKEAAFPQIRGARMERLFFSVPEHNAKMCTICRHPRQSAIRQPRRSVFPERDQRTRAQCAPDDDEGFVEGSENGHGQDKIPFVPTRTKPKEKQRDHPDWVAGFRYQKMNDDQKTLPPQTVLAGVVRELEDDFAHYKSIYVELADEYKLLDAVSNVPKRHLLALHLREIIDILEQKGDQIASLYDLLTFKDKPRIIPSFHHAPSHSPKTVTFR